ncbi:hypothetical protein [Halomonas sp. NO4]|uniref:hypothetical protein n=1 Tax=Halomonas sp. NO4 TaxID=2484813 RepID=UPI0013D40F18|nr:hypothetical protein [Halomonas sp. NO4]
MTRSIRRAGCVGGCLLGLAWAGLVAASGLAWGQSSVSSVVVSSSAGGHASAEAVITGPDAAVAVNGDRLEVRDGRLTLNGVAYGRVADGETVTYRVRDGVRTLQVDGVPREPME